jgi:NADPH-dependent 2,4-dienoyl-CoA reductase/sulfur reductase-like enzyme/Fe-S-cluster-containing hydrogenase component 2/bacterioferritin-associated ferredoxin
MTRIEQHPIVRKDWKDPFTFTFASRPVTAYPGDMISSALFAAGFRVFGHHSKDGAPQGIYCANGQCSQCLVFADGLPVKACMTAARPGMSVEPVDGLPSLPAREAVGAMRETETHLVSVLILGGGPAGLSAAIELGSRGIDVLLVDDKERLGGKLVLQTHRFFGSTQAVFAGTRGIDIGTRLEKRVRELETVTVWLESTALAVFSDRIVGVLRKDRYVLVRPQILLVATGAREKSLVFQGNTLPGVYGAGAFQTLVNRDLVKAADRLFIVGGGNVGLIAGYHALQAGIDVVGLVEALPECGGYKVHKDKLARMGVPIYTSHTILSARGVDSVESVTVAKVDANFRPIPGTEMSFACDTVLIAVGLDPVDEFIQAAREADLPVVAAGDAEEIAEASAAIFAGKIRGLEIARTLGVTTDEVPEEWRAMGETLKSRPGPSTCEIVPGDEDGVIPVFHCSQEIPCNPCTSVCPQKLIVIDEADIRRLPQFLGAAVGKACVGCDSCVAICPGLAITLVDFRKDREEPTVTIPLEFGESRLRVGDLVTVLDTVGEPIAAVEVDAVRRSDRTLLVKVRLPRGMAKRAAGLRMQESWVGDPLPAAIEPLGDDAIVCRCERIRAGEIRERIRAGLRDMNEIKTVTRAGMGACGGKTCTALIARLFREEGVPASEITENVRRPLFVEVPLGVFAGVEEETL